jgi:hypothetical protein
MDLSDCPNGCCACCETLRLGCEPMLRDSWEETVGLKVDVTPVLQALLAQFDGDPKSPLKVLSRLLTPSTPQNAVHLWKGEKSNK